MPDPSRPERTPHSNTDPNPLASLEYVPVPLSPDRMKNFRLAGTGLNPVVVYGSLFLLVACWFVGAYLLSIFGPFFALFVMFGLFGTAFVLSQKQAREESRINMGLCPRCGYDLRANNDRCPECGTAIPEQILRWRRLRPPLEPGMPGYVKPTLPSNRPPVPRPPDPTSAAE
jgi:hypothetical protein